MTWAQRSSVKPRLASPNSSLGVSQIGQKEFFAISKTDKLWAIIGACDEPKVPPKIYEVGEERAVCLYRGEAEAEYSDIAPFLAHVDDFLLAWIIENLWTKPWGIFAITRGELNKLRTHFRKFLIVKDPDGEEMYFRYYDPRILKAFLPACNDDELHKFFGPFEAFGVTDSNSDQVTIFSWQKSGNRVR